LKNSFPFRARFVAMKSKDVAAQRKSINLHRRSRSLSLTAVENQKTLFIPSPAQRVFPYPPLFAARFHHIPSFRIQSNPLHPAARIPAERLMQKSHSQSARNNFRSAADGKMKLSRCKQPWLVGNLGPRGNIKILRKRAERERDDHKRPERRCVFLCFLQ
jgi:hypothetical protein